MRDLREGQYGEPRRTRVFARDVWHLALVHTRQAGAHGSQSPVWYDRHSDWLWQLREAPPSWVDEVPGGA
jgi:hypothetical protein